MHTIIRFSKIFLICIIFTLACNSNQDKIAQVSTAPIIQQETKNVEPVSACKVLTDIELKKVFSDKIFTIESDRNDPPNIYEALSVCSYKEKDRDVMNTFGVELEIRANASASEALKFINSKIEMDYDKRGRVIENLGDRAYFYNTSMTYGGPTLEFVKNNVYYKMKIMVFNGEALKLAESQLTQLANLILSK